ncbi:hypothetical protein BD289DRAFT_163586 [Coniella lustricola]|uniref:Uncharacterized protein n=1 Tax=Coniella lustricola TaxID=2025994 RepID=A0A2T3AEC1_9PEZI|nr:hypothetical protein BD289DRAFT_163586 [Coniella lustricola]
MALAPCLLLLRDCNVSSCACPIPSSCFHAPNFIQPFVTCLSNVKDWLSRQRQVQH